MTLWHDTRKREPKETIVNVSTTLCHDTRKREPKETIVNVSTVTLWKRIRVRVWVRVNQSQFILHNYRAAALHVIVLGTSSQELRLWW